MYFHYQARTTCLGGTLLAALAVSASVACLAASGPVAPDRTVRIGVFSLFRPRELLIRPADGSSLSIQTGSETLRLEVGEAARLAISAQAVECTTDRRIVTAPVVRISARSRDPLSGDFVLAVPGKIERRFRGALEVRLGKSWLDAGSLSPETLVAVVTMRLEAAVASVVEAESPPGAGIEALKSQAVAARSYYVAQLAARPRHAGFGFCDTTHCQFLRALPEATAAARLATSATRGLILTYRGFPLAALYSASCGGRTRTLAEVGMAAADSDRPGYPYFAVACPNSQRRARTWTARIDSADLSAGGKTGALVVQGVSSEAARVRAARRVGWTVLPANNYEVDSEDGTLVVRGRGAGHGVGLCQEGARGMAESGADFRAILSYYYPNTRIEAITP